MTMTESFTHMGAFPFDFIDHTNLDPAEIARSKDQSYIGGLLYERRGYQSTVDSEQAKDDPDKERLEQAKQGVSDVDAELARVGADREPRNQIRK